MFFIIFFKIPTFSLRSSSLFFIKVLPSVFLKRTTTVYSKLRQALTNTRMSLPQVFFRINEIKNLRLLVEITSPIQKIFDTRRTQTQNCSLYEKFRSQKRKKNFDEERETVVLQNFLTTETPKEPQHQIFLGDKVFLTAYSNILITHSMAHKSFSTTKMSSTRNFENHQTRRKTQN